MASDKALGPNGLTMGFFQACWEMTKGNHMQVFQDFHTNARLEKTLNATFLALIHKKWGMQMLETIIPSTLWLEFARFFLKC